MPEYDFSDRIENTVTENPYSGMFYAVWKLKSEMNYSRLCGSIILVKLLIWTRWSPLATWYDRCETQKP